MKRTGSSTGKFHRLSRSLRLFPTKHGLMWSRRWIKHRFDERTSPRLLSLNLVEEGKLLRYLIARIISNLYNLCNLRNFVGYLAVYDDDYEGRNKRWKRSFRGKTICIRVEPSLSEYSNIWTECLLVKDTLFLSRIIMSLAWCRKYQRRCL